LVAASRTLTYCISGCTHSATLLGSVHGVVVHARRAVSGSSASGNVTTTDGSIASL
jgi:hypothetical protein